MSTVIKAGQAGKLARRLSTVDLADHWQEAAAVIEAARAEAARIVEGAKEEARRTIECAGELARVKGYEKGYAEGLTGGREEALIQGKLEFAEKHANLAGVFQSAVTQFEETKEQLRLNAEKDLLDFAILAASKLTFAIGNLHREAACENFRRALALVTGKSDVVVRGNAKDIETLRVFAESVLESARSGQHVRLIEDNSVSPGGCVLQRGKAEVDASLDTQVSEMVSALVGKASDA
jgi:flagellar assembly protein FliH